MDMTVGAVPNGLIGACCSLGAGDVRDRLREWRALRDRSAVDSLSEGVRLRLADDERIETVAHLAASESECCPFYRFTILIDGTGRSLAIEAGPGGAPAVRALLGLGD
jgi:hypothetical protein